MLCSNAKLRRYKRKYRGLCTALNDMLCAFPEYAEDKREELYACFMSLPQYRIAMPDKFCWYVGNAAKEISQTFDNSAIVLKSITYKARAELYNIVYAIIFDDWYFLSHLSCREVIRDKAAATNYLYWICKHMLQYNIKEVSDLATFILKRLSALHIISKTCAA